MHDGCTVSFHLFLWLGGLISFFVRIELSFTGFIIKQSYF